MVGARIVGFGSALPPGVGQTTLWDGFFARHFGSSRIAERIFTNSGVAHRHTVVDPLTEDVSRWGTEQRMLRYAEEAPSLGLPAVRAALADAGLDASEVGMLAVVSCTGYATPGLDIAMADLLPLPSDARRVVIGHMGCYAALPALATVSDYVAAQGKPAVLLCVELTSLHLQPATDDPQQVVAHALFGDAAAAVVLAPDSGPGWDVVDIAFSTDTATREHMTWDVTDLGFRMGLSPKVPALLATHLGPLVHPLLTRNGLAVADVAGWAVHPGGPSIMDTVERELDLPADRMDVSRSILADRGNCSSATVLLVLQRLATDTDLQPGDPVLALAFGPGLTLCAALLRRT